MNIFDGLIWGGATLSLVGLAGLVWCIVKVWSARRAQLELRPARLLAGLCAFSGALARRFLAPIRLAARKQTHD